MSIHVMDGELFKASYYAPEIRQIFDEKAIIESWLKYEAVLAEVQGEMDIIPREAAKEINKKASLKYVKFNRIVEINSEVKLASVATVRALAEVCDNGAGEFIHYGTCSPELFENSLAYRLGKTMDLFEKDLENIYSVLLQLANKHKHTILVDRSHGQQGTPTTFGFVAAIWADAFKKNIERFKEARKRVLIGSLKGAYGNSAAYYAIAGPKCVEMEKKVLEKLGLYYNKISVRRHIERFAEFLNLLSLLAMTVEKICDDIFCNQRNEIAELEEPFDTEHQIGSSTMPHKRNPVLSEGVIAWSKKIRSNTSAFSETHTRDNHDIIVFYMEDLIIPESCLLTGAILNTMKYILNGLNIKKEGMQKNLQLSRGLIMTEALMIALSKKTKKKQTAHHIFHKIAMDSFEKGLPFDECILRDAEIKKHLTIDEINNLLNPENYLGLNDRCIEDVIGQ
jgi:adenylosuccinate lyase